jgi:hypothetical protein
MLGNYLGKLIEHEAISIQIPAQNQIDPCMHPTNLLRWIVLRLAGILRDQSLQPVAFPCVSGPFGGFLIRKQTFQLRLMQNMSITVVQRLVNRHFDWFLCILQRCDGRFIKLEEAKVLLDEF